MGQQAMRANRGAANVRRAGRRMPKFADLPGRTEAVPIQSSDLVKARCAADDRLASGAASPNQTQRNASVLTFESVPKAVRMR
ncbi:hypothetical protein A8H39_12345 [Paraburkholderia fungorum]|jgi:hypothetical protein|nr:hypothetical protein [Paraburkholderia fungorum]PNE56565.1 hypothetical protein A8H39_12345 [Paraburkholderia fungorum]PZR46968.1 MAG: hypothetical protein DI523_15855 [Paraburkholderia fungorum]